MTAGGVQETELNAQIKYCSAKHEKYIMVSNGRWQWAVDRVHHGRSVFEDSLALKHLCLRNKAKYTDLTLLIPTMPPPCSDHMLLLLAKAVTKKN